jgi:hypothetical protein
MAFCGGPRIVGFASKYVTIQHLAFLLYLLVMCKSAKAAETVQGVASYEFFAESGQRLVRLEESFEAVVEDKHWLIRTRLLKLDPPVNSDQVFCPPSQTVGSDGVDCFYLKNMRVGSTNRLVGWVEPGGVPNVALSPTVVVLWLGYCSGSYFNTETKTAPPVWVGGSGNLNRQQRCQMPIHVDKNDVRDRFVRSLYYLNDGRSNPCEAKTALHNVLPPPWSNGFTQAVFRVEQTFGANGVSNGFPRVFRFNVFMPWGEPGGAELKLYVSSSISAKATNVITDVSFTEWIPNLPDGVKVGVYDYRFTDVITNSDAVSYVAKGQWRSKADKEVERAVKVLSTRVVGDTQQKVENPRLKWLRMALFLLVGVPGVAILIFIRKSKKSKQTTATTYEKPDIKA